ncbi:MAG: nucleotidyltransferase domain-containing protein [Candidatus Aenigmarchaeota archaeon]|nr:nucleotidyltransferase domain-containing protein [Candidatus Aenigmarchaeota archaeon]
MLQNYNKWAVLKVFFDNPSPEGFGLQLREISRAVKLAPTSVKNYLDNLEKEGLIVVKRHRVQRYPEYRANRESEKFRFLKKTDILFSIRHSGLLKYLDDVCMPDAIVLFGSAARGEDTADSDIDIFLLCKEKKLDLKKFEKKLKRKISPFFSSDFNKLSDELKNNIINGLILKGYLKVF